MELLTITSYERSHRRHVMDLLRQDRLSFIHLDWHNVQYWLDIPEVIVRVAWENGHLIGILATSPPLSETVWIRLAVFSHEFVVRSLFKELWAEMTTSLHIQGVTTIVVLVTEDWLLDYIPQLGFTYKEKIVMLRRPEPNPAPTPHNTDIKVRSVYLEDLPHIVKIDHSAFDSPWQMSAYELRQARRSATYCTIAELDKIPVGYQLSTLHQQVGHLARLAVLPEFQNMGVGRTLLYNLVVRMKRQRVESMTVNTQERNLISQRLYQQYGFQRNGNDLHVWIATVD